MQKFIKKLIDRLEELKKAESDREDYSDNHDYYDDWEYAFGDGASDGRYYAYAKAIKIIKELAEEYKDVYDTNVGKWIPVSEKLPEYNAYSDYYESVIVTLDNGRVVDGCYRNMDKEWWVDDVDGEHYSVNATGHVIAWQPLPKPYKGE